MRDRPRETRRRPRETHRIAIALSKAVSIFYFAGFDREQSGKPVLGI